MPALPVPHGRDRERADLHRLLDEAAAGRGAALLVHGDAGIGKTTLIGDVLAGRTGHRLLLTGRPPAAPGRPFAGLHRLCAPVLDHVERLPQRPRAVLGAVFDGHHLVPDRFVIGVAMLRLLTELARDQPVVCVVDDVDELDEESAQALSFLARRIRGEAIAVLFVAQRPSATMAGVARLHLAGLADLDARRMLSAMVPGPVDARIIDRIVAEAGGNPGTLLEYVRATSPSPADSRVPPALALEELDPDTRMLLLVAAAEPLGDPLVLWRAANALGIGPAVVTAEATGLLRIGTRVLFRHPLLRTAVYLAAPAEQRRRAHRVLAAATDPEVDPGRRAWHRVQSVAWPDQPGGGSQQRMVVSSSRALTAASSSLQYPRRQSHEPRRTDAYRKSSAAGGLAGPATEPPVISQAGLTEQEKLVIGHVAQGLTNKEIGAVLFLSPRTIDAHLRRIFRKLRITSRRRLRELWRADAGPAPHRHEDRLRPEQ